MTLRELRYSEPLFIGVANVGLGIWALAEAKYALGAFLLVLAAASLWRVWPSDSRPKSGGDASEADT